MLPEPPYQFIFEEMRAGNVIPFLGAGASLAARADSEQWTSPSCSFLPTSTELAEYLDRLSEYPSSETRDLTRVSQYLDVVTGRAGLDGKLRQIFAKPYDPAPIHEFLASFSNLLIVTTNYDTLLERAFAGRPHHVLVYNAIDGDLLAWRGGSPQPVALSAGDDSFEGLGELPVIFKMHGMPHPTNPELDSYVITEDDYVEFLSRMEAQTAIPKAFAEHFRFRHFLFLGYGLKDWNLRVILHKLWHARYRPQSSERAPRRRASWAIQRNVSPLEREFWSRRGLSIYEMSIDEFLGKLREHQKHGTAG